MSAADALFLIVCSIGTVNSLLFALYLFISKKGHIFLNRLLAFVLLSFTLRISKTIWVFLYADIHYFYHFIYYTLFLATGPLIYLYYSGLKKLSLNSRRYYQHLLIPGLFIIVHFIVNWQRFGIQVYYFIVFVLVIYFIISLSDYIKGQQKKLHYSISVLKWCRVILIFYFGLVLINLSRVFLNTPLQKTEAVYYSLWIYCLIYTELKFKIVTRAHRAEHLIIDGKDPLLEKLMRVVRDERIYLDPDLTLRKVAVKLSISGHQLSHYLNTRFGQNFNDFINGFRIEEAKRLLKDPAYQSITIATIAFECGFNSLSVFNPAFKKTTGMTPSKYQTSTDFSDKQ